jgi:2-phospho-L-lactate guanylyltransferase
MGAVEYVVVVPVKPPAVGKSRLGGIPAERRRELAAAFALDTVAACLATPGVAAVMAVTDDAHFARRLADAGCAVLPDGHSGDLNASIRLAAAEALRRWPGLHPVALCADLPALTPTDLAGALDQVAGDGSWFVADAAGTGTTMYAAPAAGFDPRFGPGSRGAHLDAGAREVEGALPTLRQDVDDQADLERARALGLGSHTAAV